jgi:hypothetical protein
MNSHTPRHFAPSYRVRTGIILLALTASIIGLSAITWPSNTVCADTTDCVSPPPDPNKAGWKKGTTVYYDVSGLPSNVQQQAKDAFAAWTDANKSNGSGVTFAQSDASHPANFTVTVGPADGRPGKTNTSLDATNISTGATTSLDLNNTSFFDSGQAGYDTAILKIMLHEIGHTMGITDTPGDDSQSCGGQTPAGSVMNGQCGVNDKSGNSPTTVTKCDSNVVSQKPQYITSTADYGSGGGGGGSDYYPSYGDYCTPYYWYYYVSSDGGQTWEQVGDPEYAGCW